MKLQVYKGRMGQAGLPTRATFAKVNGKSRIIVPIENAVITDAIGVALSGLLFFATDSLFVKILALGGAAWMGTALVTKLVRLPSAPEVRLTALTLVEAPEAPAPEIPEDVEETFVPLIPPLPEEQPLPDVVI